MSGWPHTTMRFPGDDLITMTFSLTSACPPQSNPKFRWPLIIAPRQSPLHANFLPHFIKPPSIFHVSLNQGQHEAVGTQHWPMKSTMSWGAEIDEFLHIGTERHMQIRQECCNQAVLLCMQMRQSTLWTFLCRDLSHWVFTKVSW